MTSELIEGIRVLKMYTWELIFSEGINKTRDQELKLFKSVRSISSFSRAIAYSTHAATTFLVYLLFTVMGGTMTAPSVFATHYMFAFMKRFSAIFVGQSIVFLAEASLLLQRLSVILDTPEVSNMAFEEPLDKSNSVEFEKMSASWNLDSDTNDSQVEEKPSETLKKKYFLQDISLSLKKKSLNALVGKVGSGKSTLLLSLTGEMPKYSGTLRQKGSIAYVEQEPTIFAGTIRENILFGKEFEEEFYNRVVRDCNLESDFKLFADSDLTDVGERGNNLSGGQKARLALARAIYSDADIYLLDDPLSAVDAKVSKSLYENAIKGLLKEKTVVLATHQVHFVKDADQILVIEEGKIIANGTFQHLKETYRQFHFTFPDQNGHEHDEKPKIVEEDIAIAEERLNEDPIVDDQDRVDEKEIEIKAEPQNLNQALEKIKKIERVINSTSSNESEDGKVTLKTYGKYFAQMGNSLVLFSTLVLTQLGDIVFGRILAAWTTSELEQGTSIAVIGGIVAFIFVIFNIHYILFDYMAITSSKRYQKKMLSSVVRSPVAFFDANPLGKILNRFSNDIGAIDVALPGTLIDTLDENTNILCLVIAVMVIEPYTIPPTVFGALTISLLTKYCFPAIKQTRNYELISRGPLSSQFSSTLSGIVVLRCFKQTKPVSERFENFLEDNTKGSVGYITSSRFFAIYVDVFYAIVSIGNSFIILANGNAPGLTAFALMLAISVTGAIQFALRQLLQTHIFMSSPARVQSYCEMNSEAALTRSEDEGVAKTNWPQKGKIDFNRVYMKYRPDLDYVLKDLSVDIKAGQKIGCVGRTGAGKSTILQILFRLVEIDKHSESRDSSFVKIDDVNTEKLGLHLLRDNIAIIPQMPFCFTGTVKKNLDPLGKHSEEELWRVLEDVNLKNHVESLKDGLNTDMTDASSVFSVGQKQLICLARTILKKKKILVLDEATANIDIHTDNFIQKKISEKFVDSTVLAIAHRLTTVAHYDRILVLDKGMKMEYDHPYKLLVKNIGEGQITNKEGHFASMVMNTGEKTSAEILRIAKEAFYAKSMVEYSS